MAKSAERVEFLSDILGTAIEGGINYWAQFESIEKIDDSNDILGWRYEQVIVREAEDPDEIHKINLDTIAKGLGILRKRNADRDKDLLLANRTNGYEGDFDALDADKIVQFALFGDLVYG